VLALCAPGVIRDERSATAIEHALIASGIGAAVGRNSSLDDQGPVRPVLSSVLI
jgi:hypothetical protein